MKIDKEIAKLAAWGFVLIFIISLPMKNMILSLYLTIFYMLFFYGPFLPVLANIKKLSSLERFALANAAGLSYTGVFVVLDVVFDFFLVKPVYIITTLIIYIGSTFFYLKS